VLQTFEREYPFGWLGVLAQVEPSMDELVYAHHERGFALLSLRSPTRSRYYVQVRHDEDVARGRTSGSGRSCSCERRSTAGRCRRARSSRRASRACAAHVTEPMQYGRLFLAGDAAHIVPPTGAKGLNLAIHDVRILGEALVRWYASGDESQLDGYSQSCLRRVWRAEHFSWWMTSMLHRLDGDDPFDLKLQLSQLRYVTTSEAAATSLAENYVGLTTV